ncbi:hypothetical protein NLI96_g5248 [Meripilus lineatus]|uniref:DUF803-domain-containing protein n=1 Tax=Meripilus lineatus TaxID=2056292 RepID=A0AAD5V369_9APHY|nr:hypothetical protein NLI96_g5248 [Physisporinus lineatus]
MPHFPYPQISYWPTLPQDIYKIEFPKINRATLAGITVAIAGNVLISLALNCQKLAHRRLEDEREAERAELDRQAALKHNNHLHDVFTVAEDTIDTGRSSPEPSIEAAIPGIALLETQPLLHSSSSSSTSTYGSNASDVSTIGRGTGRRKRSLIPTFWHRRSAENAGDADPDHVGATHALLPVDVVPVSRPPLKNRRSSSNSSNQQNGGHSGSEGDYLKSKLWWLGFILMNVGEVGNFISYAFAPASVVAPLGTFALIANCFFAPLMLGERFRKLDLFGIFVAIVGAVTVVLSTNPSDVRLNPEGLVEAIKQRTFIIYSIVYAVGVVILSGLSEGSMGKRWVYVDVGLCALFGGFTVLSTKAVSTLLTMEWFEIFTEWITYPVIAVLLGTGVGQIRYLNRALMRFDSKIVVPTQFVFFNLSAIVGSAILYGDFKRASFHQIITFLYGCCATFLGVFIITWSPNTSSEEDSSQDVEEGPGVTSTPASVRLGSLSRHRATLIIPDGVVNAVSTPSLRRKQSDGLSMIGFSPAQRLLVVHTPPRDVFVRPLTQEPEREGPSGSSQSPESVVGRRRTTSISWAEQEPSPRPGQIRRPRGPSIVGKREGSRSRNHAVHGTESPL